MDQNKQMAIIKKKIKNSNKQIAVLLLIKTF